MILLRTDDLDAIEPLLTLAPPEIFKYVVAQYSKVSSFSYFFKLTLLWVGVTVAEVATRM